MISNRIMKLHEFEDCIVFRSACSCNDKSHDLWISVELDEENHLLNIVFTANVSIYWDLYDIKDSLIKRIVKIYKNVFYRIKKSFKLLFTGYLEMETGFIMDDENSIKDFLDAINNSVEIIKNRKDV